MNIIEEQRNDIITNNNTAQQRFENILDMLNKGADELIVNEPLDGDIDLSDLETTAVRTLQFSPGQITSIKNVPTRLRVLEIPQNLLVDLPDLPITLQTLNVTKNYISTISFKTIPGLERLQISNNNLEEISDLPPRLLELHISENRLSHIDFGNAKKLEVVDITGNQISVVDNLPSTVSDFQSEGNPSITYYNSSDAQANDNRKNTMPEIAPALNTYFHLKHVYEEDVSKRAKSAYNTAMTKNQSKKIAKSKAKNVVGKCAYCKRAVGMVFDQTQSKYTVRCGSEMDPCKLDIRFTSGSWMPIHKHLNDSHNQVIESRGLIAEYSLDYVFGYKSDIESGANIKQEMDEYSYWSDQAKKTEDVYQSKFHNRENIADIAKLTEEAHMYAKEIDNHINEYKNDGSRGHIKEVLQVYKDNLLPIRNRIHRLKYNTNEILLENDIKKLNVGVSTPADMAIMISDTVPTVESFIAP